MVTLVIYNKRKGAVHGKDRKKGGTYGVLLVHVCLILCGKESVVPDNFFSHRAELNTYMFIL